MKEEDTFLLPAILRAPSDNAVPVLVGQIFEEASPRVRSSMLEHLLKPLGVLSLVAVANGVFARIVMREGWPQLRLREEDVQGIAASDVVALVHYVQQVSSRVLEGLFGIILTVPVLAGSATFAMLMALLPNPYWTQASVQDLDPPR